jgi:hypothetical protein
MAARRGCLPYPYLAADAAACRAANVAALYRKGDRQVTIDYAAVLRSKCLNGTLYRNDAKIAAWLGIPEDEVDRVINRLRAQRVLLFHDLSAHGAEVYRLATPPASTGGTDPFAPSGASDSDPWPPVVPEPRPEPKPVLRDRTADRIRDPFDPANPDNVLEPEVRAFWARLDA